MRRAIASRGRQSDPGSTYRTGTPSHAGADRTTEAGGSTVVVNDFDNMVKSRRAIAQKDSKRSAPWDSNRSAPPDLSLITSRRARAVWWTAPSLGGASTVGPWL